LNFKKRYFLILSLFFSSITYSFSIYAFENSSKIRQLEAIPTPVKITPKDIITKSDSTNIIEFQDLRKLLVENNEQLKKYRSQISQTKSLLKSKISAWSPRLNLSSDDLPSFSTGNSTNELSSDSATNQMRIGLSGTIKWDLVKPNRRLEINIEKDNLKNSEYNYNFYLKDLYLKAIKKYFLIQASMQDIKISKKAIEISKVSLKEAENRYKAGIGNKLELLESKTQLGRELILLERRIGKLNFHQNDLGIILNLKTKFRIKEDENPKILGFWNLNKEKSFLLALKNRNDLKIKEKNILINQKKAQSILSEKKPTLSIYNTYSLSTYKGESGVENPNYENTINSNSNKVGLEFDLNLFDGGLIKQNFNSLKSKEKELKAELNEKRLEIDNELKNALINLNIAESSIIISYEQVKSANESLNISLKRLEAGLTTQREIVNLQGDVSEAESNYTNSIKDYNENLFTLIRIVGIENPNFCDLSIDLEIDKNKNTFRKFAIDKNILFCNYLA
tara:strand:- start:707 stop:2230 length:1524 start_codon:yes stop_codon:yes gene_type:complete